MIRGVHAMLYSSDAAGLREFFRDKLALQATDAGDGWLMFDLPGADMGCHPSEGGPKSGTADISFYCDDIAAAMAELEGKGVEFTQEIEDRDYGLVTFIKVPGDFEIQLYQPKYKK